MRSTLIIIWLLIGILPSFAQRQMSASQTPAEPGLREEVIVVSKYFPINRSDIKRDSALARLNDVIDSLRNLNGLEKLYIEGYSSPDGSYNFNSSLALKRAKALRDYVVRRLGVAPSLIEVTSKSEDWAGLRDLASADFDMPGREEVIAIIDKASTSLQTKEQKLRRLHSGRTWRYLSRNTFPLLRRTVVRIPVRNTVIEVDIPEDEIEQVVEVPISEPEEVLYPNVVEETAIPEVPSESAEVLQECQRHCYVKTNVPAWAMLWINAAGEFDLAPHWSAQAAIYYSGFNYFHRDRKFRTFTVMPEARWWPRSDNNGFFIGAHFGMAYYNCAFGGDDRYQDHDGKTPALGGGIDLGVRFPISRNKRWLLEFSVGGGIYHLDYDIFQNVINGFLTGRRQRTFYGIDNAAISLCYRFNLGQPRVTKKKGGSL